jgi:hypothetical protein
MQTRRNPNRVNTPTEIDMMCETDIAQTSTKNNIVDLERARLDHELEKFLESNPFARQLVRGNIPPIADNEGLESFKRTVEMLRPRKRPVIFQKVAEETVKSREFEKWLHRSDKPAEAFAPPPIPFPPKSEPDYELPWPWEPAADG